MLLVHSWKPEIGSMWKLSYLKDCIDIIESSHVIKKPHLLDFCDFAVGKVNDHATPVMVMMMNNQAQARSSPLHPRDWLGSLENTCFQEEPNLFLIEKKNTQGWHKYCYCSTSLGYLHMASSWFHMVSASFVNPPPLRPWHVVLGFHTFWTPCDFESPRGQEWAWERVRKVWVQMDGYLGTPVLVVRETKRKTKSRNKPTQNDFENQHLLIWCQPCTNKPMALKSQPKIEALQYPLVFLFIYLSIDRIYLSNLCYLSIHPSIRPSICLSTPENEQILFGSERPNSPKTMYKQSSNPACFNFIQVVMQRVQTLSMFCVRFPTTNTFIFTALP